MLLLKFKFLFGNLTDVDEVVQLGNEGVWVVVAAALGQGRKGEAGLESLHEFQRRETSVVTQTVMNEAKWTQVGLPEGWAHFE